MLRHFLNDFLSFVPLQLPQLLDVTTMEEPQFYGDYVLLTFPLHDHLRAGRGNGHVRGRHGTDYTVPPYPDADGAVRAQHMRLFQSCIRADVQDERQDRCRRHGQLRIRHHLRFDGPDVRRPLPRSRTAFQKRGIEVQQEQGRSADGFYVIQAYAKHTVPTDGLLDQCAQDMD